MKEMDMSGGLKLSWGRVCQRFLAWWAHLFWASLQSTVPPWSAQAEAAVCLCFYL